MYFQEFPTIIYDSVGDGNFKDVKNLLRRVGLRVAVRTNILLYDTYDVKEGETPEIIASKLYGDPELHWVILMINNVTDRFHQWPMSTPQFLDFINEWDARNKTIACICHGGQLIISAKITEGRDVSGYYSIKDDLINSGGNFVDAPAVVSNNLVSCPHYKWMGQWMLAAFDIYNART